MAMGLMEAFALGRLGIEDVTPTQYTRLYRGVHALVKVDNEEGGYRSGHRVYLDRAYRGDYGIEFEVENVDTGETVLVPITHLDQEGIVEFIVLHADV